MPDVEHESAPRTQAAPVAHSGDTTTSPLGRVQSLLGMQHTAGNRAVTAFLRGVQRQERPDDEHANADDEHADDEHADGGDAGTPDDLLEPHPELQAHRDALVAAG